MAHFAKLNDENVVVSVEVVANDALDSDNEEVSGIELLNNLYGIALWKQTSFNGSFRKNFAGVGYKYDADLDAFIAPKPFNSWILDEQTAQWKAPIDRPAEGKYIWSEDELNWVTVDA